MTPVEERVAELLDGAAPTFGAIPFDDVASGVRRRRAVRWAGVATAATIAVVIAAVSLAGMSATGRSSRPTQPAQPAASPSVGVSGAMPWTDASASPYQPPSADPATRPATDARACTSTDVTVSLGRSGSATGHHGTDVRFRNTSRSTCVLKGYPQVTATEPGRPAVTGTNGSFFPSPGSADMGPGQDTLLTLETVAMCSANPDGSATKPPYHHISIDLPGGGTVHLDDPSLALDVTCGLHLTEFFAEQPTAPTPGRS